MCFSKYNAFSATNCYAEKSRRIKEKVYISVVKLIRRLFVTTCQTADSFVFVKCFRIYEPNVNYNNAYLSIDRQQKEDEEFLFMFNRGFL